MGTDTKEAPVQEVKKQGKKRKGKAERERAKLDGPSNAAKETVRSDPASKQAKVSKKHKKARTPPPADKTEKAKRTAVAATKSADDGKTKEVSLEVSCTVFVAGMSPSFDRDAFKAFFEKCGEIVDLSVPMRKNKPHQDKKGFKPVSRGIAFIQYASIEAARCARAKNQSTFDGKTLTVTMSKAEKSSADPAKADKEVAAQVAAKQDYTVFVTNIPHAAEEADVKAHFRECGNIAGCRVMSQKGIAFIRYKREEGFQNALDKNGDAFQGRELSVTKANAKTKGEEVKE